MKDLSSHNDGHVAGPRCKSFELMTRVQPLTPDATSMGHVPRPHDSMSLMLRAAVQIWL